jgi:hypothetical protein
MRDRTATQQLLLSDAVDRSVAHIDFSPFTGKSIYLDTQYVSDPKTGAFVSTGYIISSLRQQMMAAGCLLREKAEDAEFIVEARVGALGMDGHEINYGLPPSNVVNAAAAAVAQTPVIPPLPEISFGRKAEDSAAAKIGLFAYRRETREPVWQSGTSVARSHARSKWLMGAGPFQSGSIYNGTHFAGERLRANPFVESQQDENDQEAKYRTANIFDADLRAELSDTASSDSSRISRLPEQPADESPDASRQ